MKWAVVRHASGPKFYFRQQKSEFYSHHQDLLFYFPIEKGQIYVVTRTVSFTSTTEEAVLRLA